MKKKTLETRKSKSIEK